MPLVDTSSLRVIERLPGWNGRYFHSAYMTFAHYDFTRGSSIHEHFHAEEEVYEVTEGELEVTIDGVAQIARVGLVAIVPSSLPPHQGTAPRHPRADRHHRDKIARLETARPVRLIEGNRQRGTRRIAVTFEVQPTFFDWNAEPPQHRFDNPGVGLVRDNVVDVGDRQPVRGERFENRLRQHADRELIYLAPVHRDLVHVLGKHFGGLRMLAAAARYRQHSSGGSVGMKMRR